ncbi:hypothetical protein QQ008_06320 [Fulvivirgaceae bacterium BMA10]|uniref:Uncharacterized protein n=1 Tax=Splendidivirga corallicola TaxID=3051826 RepID=A0ABT8KJT6_9BACT|nr:hypothetical protein [Fulvivirgaceae bacterium BMA10]
MNDDNHRIAKWLQRLQQNSWEPEIFISGIIIFSLFQIPEYLEKYRLHIRREVDIGNNVDLVFAFVDVGLYWLIFGFVFHLFTRGIWGSLIGLSYVFPEGVVASKIKYQPKFQKRVDAIPSLEESINKLEKLSSSIFSISFLLFMCMIATCIWFLFLMAVLVTYFKIFGIEDQTAIGLIILVYLIGSVIYLFDFISLGLLKKSKTIAAIFYPIHWFFSRLALSGLYRHVYYTYLSHFKKWKLVTSILVYIGISGFGAVWSVMSAVSQSGSLYSNIELFSTRNGYYTNGSNYDDQAGLITMEASIQSDMIKDDILRLFVVHQYKYEEIFIIDSCNYEQRKDSLKGNELQELKLLCLNEFYKIYIDDSLYTDLDWTFYTKPEANQKGIISWVDIAHLNRGKHNVAVKMNLQEGAPQFTYANIPFYKAMAKKEE